MKLNSPPPPDTIACDCVPSLGIKLTSAPETLAPLESSTVPATLPDPPVAGWVARGPSGRELRRIPGAAIGCWARALAGTTHSRSDAQARITENRCRGVALKARFEDDDVGGAETKAGGSVTPFRLVPLARRKVGAHITKSQ